VTHERTLDDADEGALDRNDQLFATTLWTVGRTPMTSLRIKPVLTALGALAVFIVAFTAFIVAPLLLVVLVAGGMWGHERWNNRRRQPGVRALSTPRSLTRDAGSRLSDEGEQSYGFGAGQGREL
jgi:hypothetical protein